MYFKSYQTYGVPQCRVGMIEWVQNTKPLKDFMQSGFTDEEMKNYR